MHTPVLCGSAAHTLTCTGTNITLFNRVTQNLPTINSATSHKMDKTIPFKMLQYFNRYKWGREISFTNTNLETTKNVLNVQWQWYTMNVRLLKKQRERVFNPWKRFNWLFINKSSSTNWLINMLVCEAITKIAEKYRVRPQLWTSWDTKNNQTLTERYII